MKIFLTLLTVLSVFSFHSNAQQISKISSYQDYHILTVNYINERERICGGYSARGEILYYLNDEYVSSYISFDRVPGDHYELFDNEIIHIEGEFVPMKCSDGNTYYVFHAVKLEPEIMQNRMLLIPEEIKNFQQNEPNNIKR